MEWFSWVGGSAGLVALIKVGIDLFMAKSGRTKVDISNMQEMINEAHRMYDEATKRYNVLAERFDSYKEETENYLRKGNTSMAMQVLTLDFPAETDLYVYYTTSMIGSGMLIWPKGHSIHSLGLGPGDSIVSVDRIEPNEDDFYIYKIAY